MPKYIRLVSYGCASRNKQGLEEVNAEFEPTLWQSICRKPGRKKIWCRVGSQWYEKSTTNVVSDDDLELIYLILSALQRMK